MAPSARRRSAPIASASELHRQWLELVDIEGPFLAIPPLKRVWPNGIPDFRSTHPERFEVLVEARRDFEAAWEALDRDPGNASRLDAYRPVRDQWIQVVLREAAGWAESLQWGTVAGVQAQSPNRAVTVTAQAALVGSDGVGALVHVVDPTDSLRQTPNDLWAATPVDRLEALLRENNVDLGIVTDGRWWGLLCAQEGRMAASGVVDALTWVEEPRTRDAFLTLISRQHIIGGDPAERLPVMFDESVAAAEEITEALGAQVRLAVELLVQSFSESAADAKRRGRPDPLPTHTHDTYEAAVTVMMRTVFLLFAEERGLLPSGELFEQGYGISRELSRLVKRESDEGEEALEPTSLTWHRLLATSQALFSGASFENLRMPAYGGSLFDPTRFPFLTAATEHGALTISVPDRVMLHVLRSVQIAHVQGEARQISFRDVDVEQIGYIYEGLLGYTCTTVDQPYLGVIGTTGAEPEIPLSKLEEFVSSSNDPKRIANAIRDWVAEDQPSAKAASVAAISKSLQTDPDPSTVSALTQTVGDDLALRDRISPWLGLVRRDLRNHPFVVLAGGLMVKETPSRKNAGAHYTPKSLAEEVVLHALQPLCYSPGPHQTADEESWRLRSSDELLELKVADIACGSGAFLVAAARYLADRVVEAWIGEDAANAQRKDLHKRAIRQVVANCLYGADINDMAVEMCKLSLWLVSLDRDLPFSFVDDKVFVGNSLLGLTSLEQLRKLHIDPKRVPIDRRFDIFDVDIDAIVRKAVDLRERLATEIDEDDPARTSNAKRRQLSELRSAIASLREIADGIVAAGLLLGGQPGEALDGAYDSLRLAIEQAHPVSSEEVRHSARLDRLIERGLTPAVATDYDRWRPLHWVLDTADVLVENRGFDCVIGNPPFLGGHKLKSAVGGNVRDWLVNVVARGARGRADLVAYFLLRAYELVKDGGTIGLIATNTVAQTDTREVGLDQLVASGLTISRCVRSHPWPSRTASLEYAAIWGRRGPLPEQLQRVADGVGVRLISPHLREEGQIRGNPVPLRENHGVAFNGVKVQGMGFIIEPSLALHWIELDPRNKDVLLPCLNGEEINSDPACEGNRWIIDFNDRSESESASYELPFAHLVENVKPERQRLKPDGSYALRNPLPQRWWQFGDKRPALRAAIENLDAVLVLAFVSKHVMPVRVPTGQLFTHRLEVFATDSVADQAVLSSSIHWLWAVTYSSTLETRVNYSPTDAFLTFPRPPESPEMLRIGEGLERVRREVMMRRKLGVTKLYNAVNDPTVAGDDDIASLRAVHKELDQVVLEAYGWSHLDLDYGFHSYRKMERWMVGPATRIALLDLLHAENQRRSEAEALVADVSQGRRRGVVVDRSGTLFS